MKPQYEKYSPCTDENTLQKIANHAKCGHIVTFYNYKGLINYRIGRPDGVSQYGQDLETGTLSIKL